MRSIVLASCLALVIAPAALSQTIVNGDLTGPVGDAIVPSGWFLWQKTPDTCDASGPFNNTPNPWTLSPNGGTFVRAGGSSIDGQSEAFAQNVTGFTPGTSYTLSFFQSNLGFEHPTSGAWNGTDGYWDVLIDGVLAGSSSVLSKPVANTDAITWSLDGVSFVAPATAFEIALVSQSASTSGLAAYMGIDGVTIHVVPAPTAALSFVGLGLAATRRRR